MLLACWSAATALDVCFLSWFADRTDSKVYDGFQLGQQGEHGYHQSGISTNLQDDSTKLQHVALLPDHGVYNE